MIGQFLLPRYEKETGNIVHDDVLSREIFREKLVGALISKTGEYDVMWMPTEWLAEIKDYLEPMDPWLGNPKYTSPKVEFNEKNFPISRYCKVDDKLLLAPMSGFDSLVLFYRKDLFKEAGIVDSEGNPKPPEDLDEYLEDAKILTKAPKIYGTALFGKLPESAAWDSIMYIWSFGGQLFDEKTYEVTIDDPPAVEGLTFFCDLKNKWGVVPPGVATYEFPEVTAAFQTEKIAMCIQWNAAFPIFKDPKQSPLIYDKFGMAVVPGKRLSDGSIRSQMVGHQWGCVIDKNSRHKEAGWDWVQWLLLPENQLEIARLYGTCADVRQMAKPEILKEFPINEILAKEGPNVRLWPNVTVIHKMIYALAEATSAALAKTKTPKEALDDCAKQFEIHLKEGGYLK